MWPQIHASLTFKCKQIIDIRQLSYSEKGVVDCITFITITFIFVLRFVIFPQGIIFLAVFSPSYCAFPKIGVKFQVLHSRMPSTRSQNASESNSPYSKGVGREYDRTLSQNLTQARIFFLHVKFSVTSEVCLNASSSLASLWSHFFISSLPVFLEGCILPSPHTQSSLYDRYECSGWRRVSYLHF